MFDAETWFSVRYISLFLAEDQSSEASGCETISVYANSAAIIGTNISD